MDRSPAVGTKKPAVLVVDALQLRGACVVAFLSPWADDNSIKIVQIAPSEALTQSSTSLFKMILLVIGSQGVANAEPRNWIASLHAKYSNTPIVLVSEREEPEEVVAAFEAGVRGFISMSLVPPLAMEALKFIMGGGSFFPPAALIQPTDLQGSVRVCATSKMTILGDTQKRVLTVREQEVLERLQQGASNKLIARQLELRVSTVKLHIRQIMRKLGATNRTQAALSAAQMNLLAHDK